MITPCPVSSHVLLNLLPSHAILQILSCRSYLPYLTSPYLPIQDLSQVTTLLSCTDPPQGRLSSVAYHRGREDKTIRSFCAPVVLHRAVNKIELCKISNWFFCFCLRHHLRNLCSREFYDIADVNLTGSQLRLHPWLHLS
jgi:hypothetical protein